MSVIIRLVRRGRQVAYLVYGTKYYPGVFILELYCRGPINTGGESRKQGKEIRRLAVHRGESLPLRDDLVKDRGDFWGIIGGSRGGHSWVSRAVLGVFSLEAGSVGEFGTSNGTLSRTARPDRCRKGPHGFSVLCVNCPASIDLPLHDRCMSGSTRGIKIRRWAGQSDAYTDLSVFWERMGVVHL